MKKRTMQASGHHQKTHDLRKRGRAVKRLWQVILFELQNLLCRKAVWAVGIGYACAAAAICAFRELRTAYFFGIECVPVMLFSQLAPAFLVLMLLCVLSDTFAGERQRGTEQLCVVCLTGWCGRGAAKLLAALLLCAAASLFAGAVSCGFPFAVGLLDARLPLARIGGELALTPIWTVGQHCLFSVPSLFLGCLHAALLILLCSRYAKRAVDAAAIGGAVLLLEWIFHRFSFPAPLRSVNLWMFFTPYEFFVADPFGTEFAADFFQTGPLAGPRGRLLLLAAILMPFSVAAVCGCFKRTE